MTEWNDIRAGQVDRVDDLRRVHRILVSPHSASLGGTMRIWSHRWASIFGEAAMGPIEREGVVRSRPVLSAISELKLGKTAADLRATRAWNSAGEAERGRLIGALSDAETKKAVLTAERHLRLQFAAGGRRVTRAELLAYVEETRKFVARVEKIYDRWLLPAAFGLTLVEEEAVALLEFATGLLGTMIASEAIRKVAFSLLPRLQLISAFGR